MLRKVSPSSPAEQPPKPVRVLDNGPENRSENRRAKKAKFTVPRARYFVALALSVFLHGTIGGGLVFSPSHKYGRQKDQSSVDLISPEELKAMLAQEAKKNTPNLAKQIVETDKNRINDEIDPKAKYLSQFDQRVIKETRAAKTGKFTNEAGEGKKQAAAPVPQKQDDAETDADQKKMKTEEQAANEAELQAFEHGDISVAAKKGLQKFNPSFRKLPVVPDPTAEQTVTGDGREVSATDDHLKNVPTGMQTMLSTREFVYYSYYNRIKDKLRQYWEPKIREKFERTMRQGRSVASEGDRITKVVIILDEKGTLIRVQVLSASGLVDLDEAAVEAFRAAAPFPNPPAGIVEKDGTIKIRWDFVLEA